VRQIEEIVKRGRRKRKAKEIVRGARRKNLHQEQFRTGSGD
jgi:hypothetical protein